MHPDDAPNVLAQLKSTIENQNLEKYSLEYRFLHKNGQYITVKDTAKAVRDSAGKTITLSVEYAILLREKRIRKESCSAVSI